MGAPKITILSIFVLVFVFSYVTCTEFEAGGENGWVVPQSSFKYKKDSVLVVLEEEYKKCQTTKPEFYSNHYDTVFKLDRPGLFYFISGVEGHCEKGQKMIIKVMKVDSPPQAP
ncbi:hypothetical protein EUTSA_v10012202mg, partial [Eutrema salsugineum]